MHSGGIRNKNAEKIYTVDRIDNRENNLDFYQEAVVPLNNLCIKIGLFNFNYLHSLWLTDSSSRV
jgi:hypothetical protein